MRSAMVWVTVLAMAAGCAVEVQTDGQEPADVRTDKATQPSERSVNAVWHFEGIESCYDWYQQACTATLPELQCPTAIDGQPCSSPGLLCAKTRPGAAFLAEYSCY